MYFRVAAHGPVRPVREPLLELWLARADGAVRVPDWRAQAFRVIAPQADALPAIATAALRAASSAAASSAAASSASIGAWAFVATPIHFIAGLSSVSVPAQGVLDLEQAEADALAADFNRVFTGAGMRMSRGRDSLLLCIFDMPLRVATSAPEDVLGQDIWAFLPRGDDAPCVRRLMSEIEMWLFEHPLNEHRRARAVPVISGLWLWGGGATDISLPAVSGWTAGDDPLFTAFAGRAQYPAAAGPGVVVIADWPGTAAWRLAQQRWLEPAIAELRAGRLKRLELSAGDRCFSVSARGRWRFWRRPRPWWESFRVAADLDGLGGVIEDDVGREGG